MNCGKSKTELIVALDYDSLEKALDLVGKAGDAVRWYKVGSQLFTNYGPDAVKELKKRGKKVFLDLKFHDIPNTVAKAAAAGARMGADMLNVHASGGIEMMKSAVDAVKKENANTLVIAVTVLTSMTDQVLRETLGRGADCNAAGHVAHLAKFAEFAGMHGVVASAHEIQIVKKCCGSSFILVVPGIRPAFAEKNDQKRIMTPREASENGADFIVVGRPVTDAPVPSEAAKMILEEIFPPVRI